MSASNSTYISDSITSASLSRSIPFGIFTGLIIFSIPCYLFIFVQYIRKGLLQKQVRSHTILAVLICSFLQVSYRLIRFALISEYFKVAIELPIILSYLHNGFVPIPTDFFCKLWACLDYSFNVMILMLMAFTAIERYLLVFKRAFFNHHRLIRHYIPMSLCILYPIVLYIYFIFFYPCTNQFTFTMITCGGPCYFYAPAISTFDQFTNLVFPVTVSTVVSLILLSRVLKQKRHMQQQQMWKKNRRLVLQLLYIVILYNLVWLPMVTSSSILLFSTVPQQILIDLSINILPYGIYVVVLLCPYVSLMSLPELWPSSVVNIFPIVRTVHTTHIPNHLQMIHTNIVNRPASFKCDDPDIH
ncbi:unnamed protein product [Adineta ricciae]|uniref:G-protein coupled receptors family 1 profile domain-containing protein n=1 Tax=Adineta ricciae TaxID=249248 RepID=A0A814YVR6_ADIRI|nr:unnamed protein product [Adineta ricciae]CAF1233929.1 unnamed protein product [Adineta ricciae]